MSFVCGLYEALIQK